MVTDIILSNRLDMFAITETWIKANENNSSVTQILHALNDFSVIQIPRITSKGGGLALFYRKAFTITAMPGPSFQSFEHIDLSITYEKLNFQMVLIYRPPPSTKNKLTIPMFFDDFHKLLDTLDDYYQRPVILAGDFNLHLDNPQDSNVSRFLDILDSVNLLQHITTPTHKRGHTLDLLISRAEENLVHDIKVLPDIYSDHRVITSTLNYSKPPITDVLVTYRAVKNIDYNKLQSDIAELFPNPDAFDGLRLETLVTTYHESLSSTYDKYAPIITRSIKYRPHAPWFTNELRNEKREKRRLERRFRKSGLTVHKLMFEAKCADYNNLLEQSKTKYYTSKIDQSDRNQLFRLIDGLFYSRNTALPTYSLLDQLVEEFNEYFLHRINDIRAKLIPNDTLPSFIDRSPSSDLKFTCFIPPSDTQMREILPALTNKTSVLDPMPTHIIKEYSSTLLPVLKNIVTISLAEGLFPESLKTSIIRPKLKKPDLDKETLKNYRPLANISFLSKVIEKAVAIQTYSYLNTHDLLPNFQSAYRQYHSTETALIRVANDILVTVDSNVDVVLLLLDLSAAFDTLDHSILLRRLETYFGFTGSVLEWFSSYLRGRSQSVMIGSTTSTSKSLEFGVPQGSILGPLLFILYIAPLQDVIATYNLSYMFYADDNQLYIAVNPKETPQVSLDKLRECTQAILHWNTQNMLSTNPGKTEVIHFTSRFQKQPIALDTFKFANTDVTVSDKVRNLGVIMDKNLSFTNHINDMCKKATLAIRSIGRIRKYLPNDGIKRLVNALVMSRLDYSNSLLYGLPKYQIDKLQRLQNTAARLVAGTRRSDHIKPVLKDLHWLPIQSRIIFKILLMSYKIIHGLAPKYLTSLIQIHQQSRKLRSSNRCLLAVPSSRPRTTTYGDRSFIHAAPKLWNNIPEEIKQAETISIFKTRLKSFLFKNYFSP